MSCSTIEDKITHVRQLLEAGQTENAIYFIEKTGLQSPDLRNALGVCLLRLGKVEKALNILQELVFQKFLSIPKGTPALYQANYATVLLLKNYNQMAIEIINGLPAAEHPYIAQLQASVARWKKQLTAFNKFRCLLGLYPDTPVTLSVQPGDL
jgi:tetratricopeptide (TPR) repeat protein